MILRTLTLQNAIWPKRAAHDLKRAFRRILMESALFFRFEGNLRPVWRFWELWRSKMQFGQNVFRMTWKERFVHFSWKAHCFPVFSRISSPHDNFENFDAPKCDLAESSCAWPEKCVLYNFHEKATVFPFWREFEASWRFWELWRSQMRFGQNVLRMTWKERFVQFSWKAHCFPFWREFEASVTILRTLTLANAIWPKRAAHDLKRAFWRILMESALFFRFEENLRPVWRFWELWRSKMRFGQNVFRMTWKERFVQFLWKAHSFPVLKRFWGLFHDFENFDAPKCDLAKTCSAWPEKSVLYNFHGKRTVFPFQREF